MPLAPRHPEPYTAQGLMGYRVFPLYVRRLNLYITKGCELGFRQVGLRVGLRGSSMTQHTQLNMLID